MQFRRTTSRQLTWWSNMKRRLRRTTTTPFMELQHAPMLRCDHCDYHSFRKKQHNPPGGCVNLSHSGARRWGWGEDLSHYAWCSLPLPAFLCNSSGRPSARERSGVSPPHRGFHLDPAVGKNQCGEKTLPTPDTTEILLDGVRYCENVG